jgi:hypothetical protein
VTSTEDGGLAGVIVTTAEAGVEAVSVADSVKTRVRPIAG